MAEVVLDGIGTPINDPNIVGAEVNLSSGLVISNNALSPKEAFFGTVGIPVGDGNGPGNPQSFDNKGKNVTLGANNQISDNALSPKEAVIGTAGIPVGDGNAAGNPVTFDNRGKDVTVLPGLGTPIDTDTERKIFKTPLNFSS